MRRARFAICTISATSCCWSQRTASRRSTTSWKTRSPTRARCSRSLSCFWFELLDGVVDNHLISADVADLPEQFKPYADYLRGRFMLVKKADMFPIECIVRGYLAGSGLKEYRKQGTVCGIELPEGLVQLLQAARAHLHAVHQGRDRRSRREHQLRALRRDHRRGGRGGAARPVAQGVHDGARPCGGARRDHRRHQVRVRRARRQDHPGRRGAHPRLAPASGRAMSTSRARTSPASTSSSCATGSTPTGTAPAIRRACPRRSSRRPARSTSRPTS